MVALLLVLLLMVKMVVTVVVLLDVEDAVDADVLLVRVRRARPVQVEGVRRGPRQVEGDRKVVRVWGK